MLLLQEALDTCAPLGDTWHYATSFLNLGNATLLSGDLPRAEVLFEEAAARYRARGDDVFEARAGQHLGYVALLRGEYGRAEELFAHSLRALFDLGEKPGIADGLEAIAAVCGATGRMRQAGQYAEAARLLREHIGVTALSYLRPLWHPFVVEAHELLGEAGRLAAAQEGREMSLQEAVARAVSGTD